MPEFKPGELVRVKHADCVNMAYQYLNRLAIVLEPWEAQDTFTFVKFIDTGEEEELFTWRFERAPTEEPNHG